MTFFVLLLVLITRRAEPTFAKEERPLSRPFQDVRREILEADLSSLSGSLSPYQLWLIRFWQGDYIRLLDTDTFVDAFESWERQGSEAPVDLSGLFHDSWWFYFDGYDGLVPRSRATDLASQDKDFLELFLKYILSQGEGKPLSLNRYEINARAEAYLKKYPDSPHRGFVESYIHADLPPRLWASVYH